MKIKKNALALGLILLTAAGLCGCGGSQELTRVNVEDNSQKLQKLKPVEEDAPPIDSAADDDSTVPELVALADTREEAEEIARLYGIDLVSYSHGTATYTTDKNLRELMDLGLENNYPELTPNYKNELHSEQ